MTPHETTTAVDTLPDPVASIRRMAQAIVTDPLGKRVEENVREACS